MSENMRCLSFGIWVFQNSRFQFHPFTCKFDEFIFLNRQIIPLCKCTMTHSSVGGHLRCFCFLAITNRAAMSTAKKPLSISSRVIQLDLTVDLFLALWGTASLISAVTASSTPISSEEVFLFPTPGTACVVICFFFFFFSSVILTGMRGSLKVVLSSGVRGWWGGEAEE